jgi:hypothetical protein
MAGKVQCGVRNLVRLANATQRTSGRVGGKSIFCLSQLPRFTSQHRRICVAWADAFYANLLAAVVNGHGLGQQYDRAF